jgi:O-antigen/teichoic acid export membrane protein
LVKKIEHSSLGPAIIANLFGQGVPFVAALFLLPTLVRHLGAERFGAYAIALSALLLFAFCDAGMGRAVAQRLASERIPARMVWNSMTLIRTGLAISICASTLGALLCHTLFSYYVRQYMVASTEIRFELTSAAVLLALNIPIFAMLGVFNGILQARGAFVRLNVSNCIGGVLIQLGPALISLNRDASIYEVLIGFTLARGCALVISAVAALHGITTEQSQSQSQRLLPGAAKHLLTYGSWSAGCSLLAPMLISIDRLLLGALIGPRQANSYILPFEIVVRLQGATVAVCSALFPRFAGLERARAESVSLGTTHNIIIVATALCGAAICGMWSALNVWINSDFANSAHSIALLLALATWVHAVVAIEHTRYLASTVPRALFFSYLIQVPAYLGLLIVLVKAFGASGAAAAWLIRTVFDAGFICCYQRVFRRLFLASAPVFLLLAGACLVQRWSVKPTFESTAIALSLCCVAIILCGRQKLRHNRRL